MSKPVGTVCVKNKVDFAKFVSLEVQGYSTGEIIKELWGIEKGDKSFNVYEHRLSAWRKNPNYDKMWMEFMGKLGRELLSEGLRKLRKQVRSEQDWLANKAANDVVNFAKGRVFGDEDKTVTVKIEGMPELGVPDKAEE